VPGGRLERFQMIATSRTGVSRVVLAALLLSGCGRSPSVDDRVETLLGQMDMAQRAAQLIAISVDLPTNDAADRLLSSLSLNSTAPAGALGAIWIASGDAGAVAHLADSVRGPRQPSMILGTDIDEGVGGTIFEGTAFPPFMRMLAVLDEGEMGATGEAIGEEAARIGFDLGLVRSPPLAGGAALADLPFVNLSNLVAAFGRGIASSGILPVLSLFSALPPDSEQGHWDRARFELIEIPILEAAIGSGFGAIAPGLSIVPAVTGDSAAFVLSPSGIRGLLRRDAGWSGLVIADLRDLGASAEDSIAAPLVQSLVAGGDLVIISASATDAVEAILAAISTGELPPGRVEEAARRVLTLKVARADARERSVPADSATSAETRERAGALAESAASRLVVRYGVADWAAQGGGMPIVLLHPVGRGRSFVREFADSYPTTEVPVNLTADSAAVAALIAEVVATGGRVMVLDFPSSAALSLDRLVQALPDSIVGGKSIIRIAFRSSRVHDPGDDPPHILAWGLGAASQLAAARAMSAAPDHSADPFIQRSPGGQDLTHYARTLRLAPADSAGMDEAGLTAADEAIERGIRQGTFTSAALAIGRRGQLVRLRGYGEIAPGGPAVDPDRALFDLASLTKIVGTTSAVAHLVETGRLDLDVPVVEYLPEFTGDGKTDVTMRHLLSHTAGLPAGLPLFASSSSADEAMERVIRQPLRRPPGELAEYSDLGMILLAEIVERVSGMPIDHLLTARFYLPLDMGHTMFLPPAALRSTIVPSALRTERPFPLAGVVHDGNAFRLGGIAGHAGIFSSLRDVAVFAQMILNGGAYGTARVLEDSTIEAFAAPQPDADGRALGWDTPADRSSAGRFFSQQSIGHTGYTGTSIWIDPTKELFVVFLTNRTYTGATADAILRVRQAVHDAAALAISDQTVGRRPGAE